MRGLKKNRMGRGQIYIYIYNVHRDSMIESAQWADTMKTYTEDLWTELKWLLTKYHLNKTTLL